MSTAAAMELETRIDIPLCTREPMLDLLNQQLADTFDLYSQVK